MHDTARLTAWTEQIASRWNLTLQEPIKLTTKGAVYKVSVAGQPAILKVNKRYGVEGGAVPFLKQVPDGIAAGLLRSSPLRRAILLDFIEGPTLQEFAVQNGLEGAEMLLAEAAVQLKNATFRYPFVFADQAKKIAYRMKQLTPVLAGTNAQYLARVSSLFDHLVRTTRKKHIVHGDLYLENVILTPLGVRMIDAKGFRADPSAEFATALVDGGLDTSIVHFSDSIVRRAGVFADAIDEEPQRVIQWGAVIWVIRHYSKAIRSGGLADSESPYIARYLDLAEA